MNNNSCNKSMLIYNKYRSKIATALTAGPTLFRVRVKTIFIVILMESFPHKRALLLVTSRSHDI